jgi:hypothetical protein
MNEANHTREIASPSFSSFKITGCSAWSSDCTSPASWEAWFENPEFPESVQGPKIPFVQASLRRRASAISKMMMWVTHAVASSDDSSGSLHAVFATEGGESATTLELLEQLAAKEALSPIKFSLSVHNASAGLYSLANKNTAPSTTISAGAQTVACGLLEALAMLNTTEVEKVLFVAADEWLPAQLRNNFVPTCYHYALAILLSKEDLESAQDSPLISWSYNPSSAITPLKCEESNSVDVIPQPFQLIRWLLDSEKSLVLDGPSFSLELQKNSSCRNTFKVNDVE